jgi:hypothetical protein
MQHPVEELLWFAHVVRLWTHVVDNKKTSIEGTKEEC